MFGYFPTPSAWGGLANYEIRVHSVILTPGGRGASIGASCTDSAELALVGGGGEVVPGANMARTTWVQVRDAPPIWATSTGGNPYPDLNVDLRSFAICASGLTTAERSTQQRMPPNSYGSATATCPAGSVMVGGGGGDMITRSSKLTDSFPSSNNSWTVYTRIGEPDVFESILEAVVVCAS